MIDPFKRKHKTLKNILPAILLLLLIAAGGFFLWAHDYYHAEDLALTVMKEDPSIQTKGNLTILSPEAPSDTGIIFYPGAKVEAISYLPLLEKLTGDGYTCVLVKMPLNMAIFAPDAAADVFKQLPDISHWYIAGHSMGGAMASSYASKHPESIDGLILLGAYIYGDYPPDKTLTVYGTFNLDLEKHIDYTENIVKIEGGNHAQFGNYGKQKGDPDAEITADEQQRITAEAIDKFINTEQAKQAKQAKQEEQEEQG